MSTAKGTGRQEPPTTRSAQPTKTNSTSGRSLMSSAVSIGTQALAIYGGYQLACLAYDAWYEGTHKDNIVEVDVAEGEEQPSNARSRQQQSSTSSSFSLTSLWSRMNPNSTQTETGNSNRRMLIRRRRQQLRQCRIQVRQVMCRLIPGLVKKAVNDFTQFSKERQALKELRCTARDSTITNQQVELWKAIQYKSMTRLVVSIYVSSILFVVSTVQVSVILGKVQNESTSVWDQAGGIGEFGEYKWVLEQTYQYLFQHGLPSLLETVQRIVLDATPESWEVVNVEDPTMIQYVTPDDLKDMMWQRVGERLRHDATLGRKRSLLRFVQPPSVYLDSSRSSSSSSSPSYSDNEESRADEALHHRRMELLDETWDMLESPMVDDALQDSIQVMQKLMIEQVFTSSANNDEDDTLVEQLPLAQVLAGIKKACQDMFGAFDESQRNDNDDADTKDNIYLQALQQLPPVLETMDVCFGG